MDCTELFNQTFTSQCFTSFSDLQFKIMEFEKATGTHYKMKRSSRFDNRYSNYERTVLKYRAVTYACEHNRYKDAPCGFSIDIRAVDNLLKITRVCLEHNHNISPNTLEPLISEEYSVADTTEIFREYFYGQEFNSFPELQAKMNEFQEATGSFYVKRNSNLFPLGSIFRDKLKYRTLRYVCCHFGKYESGAKIRLRQKTSKMECTSFMSVSQSNGFLKVIRFNMKHTHPVSQELAVLYPKRRKLAIDEQITDASPPAKKRHTSETKHSTTEEIEQDDYYPIPPETCLMPKVEPELGASFQPSAAYSTSDYLPLSIAPSVPVPVTTVQIPSNVSSSSGNGNNPVGVYPLTTSQYQLEDSTTSQRQYSCLLIRTRTPKQHNRRKTTQESLYEPEDA